MTLFDYQDLPLKGAKLITRKPFQDSRGSFSRLFCFEDLKEAGWFKKVSQINFSSTIMAGTVRGMHYQKDPWGEVKLVNCIRGCIWDVIVDVRKDSKTYLNWHAEVLDSDKCTGMLVPEGFAHGFQTLTDNVELIYCHSKPYNKTFESGLNPLDPELKIEWPNTITEISKKDSNHKHIKNWE